MHVIEARNVNTAFWAGMQALYCRADKETSRAGDVYVYPTPVTTLYNQPWERVLFDPVRDANPFFHLFESMWMLCGESDARWLDNFVKDFSQRYAEPSGYMHGAYGQRWRRNFYLSNGTRDQLKVIGEMLRKDPLTRRAVLTMWAAERDLGQSLKDHPCNTQAYFRCRNGFLDMGITCRSNDIIWGAYGANAVHMSVLHEYMSVLAGMPQGRMYQISWNFHAYVEVFDKLLTEGIQPQNPYIDERVTASPLFSAAGIEMVWHELLDWIVRRTSVQKIQYRSANNPQMFDDLMVPMWAANMLRQQGELELAMGACDAIKHSDWRLACVQWLQRRLDRRQKRDSVLVPDERTICEADQGAAACAVEVGGQEPEAVAGS